MAVIRSLSVNITNTQTKELPMSMTTTAFIQKAKLPTKSELEIEIAKRGYDLKFLEDFNFLDEFKGACELDGIMAFVELYGEDKEVILREFELTNDQLSTYDYAISFIEGSDFISGACVAILLLVLIDICDAKVIYQDDQVWYTREMLLQEIPRNIKKGKANINPINLDDALLIPKKKKKKPVPKWLLLPLLFTAIILMKRNLISWPIPAILLLIIVIYSVIEYRKKANL